MQNMAPRAVKIYGLMCYAAIIIGMKWCLDWSLNLLFKPTSPKNKTIIKVIECH